MKRIAVKYGERIYINGRALKVARSKRAGVVNLYVDEDCPVASDAVEVVDCREPLGELVREVFSRPDTGEVIGPPPGYVKRKYKKARMG